MIRFAILGTQLRFRVYSAVFAEHFEAAVAIILLRLLPVQIANGKYQIRWADPDQRLMSLHEPRAKFCPGIIGWRCFLPYSASAVMVIRRHKLRRRLQQPARQLGPLLRSTKF